MLQNAPFGAFCNTLDLHKAIIGLENQFVVFLRVAILDRFYCMSMADPEVVFSLGEGGGSGKL